MGKITFVTRFLPSENKVYTYIHTYIHRSILPEGPIKNQRWRPFSKMDTNIMPGEESVKRFERSNGLDIALYKTILLPFTFIINLRHQAASIWTN